MTAYTDNFQLRVPTYFVLATGIDGGHHYLETEIYHNGNKRRLTAFFDDKEDERKLLAKEEVIIQGRLMDEGIHQGLILLDSRIVNE